MKQKENEFAYVLGQLMGFLSAPDIRLFLKANDVSEDYIGQTMELLKGIAAVFYKMEK